MADEIFHRAGRGGAGNFHPKTDVGSEFTEDLEAQRSVGPSSVLERPIQASNYVRSGRGGAGNFEPASGERAVSSSSTQSVPRSPVDTPESARKNVKTAVASTKNSVYRGHSGRGGAGNWRQGDDEVEKHRVEAEEMNARVRLAEQVRIDVDMGLTPPPKVHATPGSSRRDLD